MTRSIVCALLIALLLAGCAARPVNPSFAVTEGEAKRALREMADQPKKLDRPIVIIGGYLDPNVSPTYLKAQVRQATGDDRVIGVMIGFCSSFEECRQKVIDAVESAWPSDDPRWTTEVDVIGASLGGLVGRYAAAPSRDPANTRRLKVARLLTLASPHSGAVLAKTATLNEFQSDMRPGSPFISYLAEQDKDARYELFPYARLNDDLVGERYAAPPGQTPLWLPTPPLESGHGGAWHDPRILSDIFRRLRGETPFATEPRTPLPFSKQ